MRSLELMVPAPLPVTPDPAKLVVRITRTFARFAKHHLEEKRGLLRSAIKAIVLEDGAVTAITLTGTFLDCVNSSPRCSA